MVPAYIAALERDAIVLRAFGEMDWNIPIINGKMIPAIKKVRKKLVSTINKLGKKGREK